MRGLPPEKSYKVMCVVSGMVRVTVSKVHSHVMCEMRLTQQMNEDWTKREENKQIGIPEQFYTHEDVWERNQQQHDISVDTKMK